MVRQANGAFRLMGNISTADLLLGQPADIERQVFANLEAGVDIISPGCAISPRCPNVNLRAMVEAVLKWHQSRA
jgi:[methyl-Co(III) methanol-specific corrinoid protein]:coenzyme M methyltransferase